MKNTILMILVACCMITSVGVGEEIKVKPIRVLIVDGFSNHDWKHTTRCIRAVLEEKPGFKVSVATFPEGGSPEQIEKWNPAFKKYDVVIQTCNDRVRSSVGV